MEEHGEGEASSEETLVREKVLLSGIDYGGKSSIISVLGASPESYISAFVSTYLLRDQGRLFEIWDMNGQRLHRIQYLKRPADYYADASILFYVIDLLDEKRYDEAIDFLYDTLQLFDKLNVNPLISILFHKYDPDVERDSKKNRIELKITALTNKIKVLTRGREVSFFRTSIYRKSCIPEAFRSTFLAIRNIPDKAVKRKAEVEATIEAAIDGETRVLKERENQGRMKRDVEKIKERTEKLRKLLRVSKRVRQSQLAEYLGLSSDELFDNLVEWADKFGFKIDGDFIVVENSDIEGFVSSLDTYFAEWEDKERKKQGKV